VLRQWEVHMTMTDGPRNDSRVCATYDGGPVQLEGQWCILLHLLSSSILGYTWLSFSFLQYTITLLKLESTW
jgi:hypothetical protein